MKQLFDQTSYRVSTLVTSAYSTSFTLGIRMLHRSIRKDVFAIYGFVRFADEIVDTFHEYDKQALLEQFEKDTYEAIEKGISLNPILNSFQHTVNKYSIDLQLIDQFLHSMKMDLNPPEVYTVEAYKEYILGSAEVVGLMCLKVFCKGKQDLYDELRPGAMKLGSVFQKVNFLRDIKADKEDLGRVYFPNWSHDGFNDQVKKEIEEEILEEFKAARAAIRKLPREAKFGVYSAYVYYKALFMKIQRTRSTTLFERRVRIPNGIKVALLFAAKANVELKRV